MTDYEYADFTTDSSKEWVVSFQDDTDGPQYFPVVGWVRVRNEREDMQWISPVFFSSSKEWEIADEYIDSTKMKDERTEVLRVSPETWNDVYRITQGESRSSLVTGWVDERKAEAKRRREYQRQNRSKAPAIRIVAIES